MAFLRSALFLLFAVPLTLAAGFLLTFMMLLPLAWRFKVVAVWRWLINVLLRHVQGIRIRVEGLEHLPSTSCVVLCLHQSAWETLALQDFFWPCVFVLKRELFWLPGLGWGLKAIDMIGIKRTAKTSALQQVIEQGQKHLQRGTSVIIFPEGTRRAPGQMGVFQPGGALLAARSGAPAVPVAHNAGKIWPRNAFVKHPGTVHLRFGPPIDSTGLKAKTINERAKAWISAQDLGAEGG